MAKNVAIILSGSGVYDGSELHETVLTLLALEKARVTYQTFAPNIEQSHVINHLTGEVTNEVRNILVESNRVGRGQTKDLALLSVDDFDALVFVGGFGAAKNLSSFAFDGENYQVNPEIEKQIKAFNAADKYILAMCIAPVILAKCIDKASITIGSDSATIGVLENATSAEHVVKTVVDCHIDENNKLITTPAYMLAQNLVELDLGITAGIRALSERI